MTTAAIQNGQRLEVRQRDERRREQELVGLGSRNAPSVLSSSSGAPPSVQQIGERGGAEGRAAPLRGAGKTSSVTNTGISNIRMIVNQLASPMGALSLPSEDGRGLGDRGSAPGSGAARSAAFGVELDVAGASRRASTRPRS